MACSSSGPFDFGDPCVRASWSTFIPATFVFVLCLSSLPAPAQARKVIDLIKWPFQPYLTLNEAEALDSSAAQGDFAGDDDDDASVNDDALVVTVPLWRTLALTWIALAEALIWLGIGSFRCLDSPFNIWNVIRPILISCTWLYAAMRPVFTSLVTPPKDLFMLYLLQFTAAILLFGGMLFDHNAVGMPLPHFLVVFALTANLVAVGALLAVILNIPLAIPSKRIRKEDIVSVIPNLFATQLMLWTCRENQFPQRIMQRYWIG
jgi:hypothetical protein